MNETADNKITTREFISLKTLIDNDIMCNNIPCTCFDKNGKHVGMDGFIYDEDAVAIVCSLSKLECCGNFSTDLNPHINNLVAAITDLFDIPVIISEIKERYQYVSSVFISPLITNDCIQWTAMVRGITKEDYDSKMKEGRI